MVGLLSLYETDVSLAKDFESGEGGGGIFLTAGYMCVCVYIYI
jgi:hypothetical protein